MNVRLEVVFTGHVQGVFFRKTTADLALGFDVSGWVRNESDGTVRMVAEGTRAELDAFIAAIRQAKRDHITDVRIEPHPATGAFDDFIIQR
jgi:acylphosphatase